MRKPRILKQNARYHVMARANRQEMILESTLLKDMFLEVVKRARKKYAFLICNFCIMGNHLHFIMQPLKDENLSRIMQWILSVYAMKYNRYYQITGHVWYDRFKSRIIHDFRQFVSTFIYILENPVHAKIVEKPSEYEYSGIYFINRGWFDVISPPDIAISLIMATLGCPLIQ